MSERISRERAGQIALLTLADVYFEGGVTGQRILESLCTRLGDPADVQAFLDLIRQVKQQPLAASPDGINVLKPYVPFRKLHSSRADGDSFRGDFFSGTPRVGVSIQQLSCPACNTTLVQRDGENSNDFFCPEGCAP